MAEKINTVLLLVVIGLLAYGLFFMPPTGRYQPMTTDALYFVVLDTKTGQSCLTVPRDNPYIVGNPWSEAFQRLPSCSAVR